MINISRVISHVAHVLQEQYRNVQTTLNIHHQSNEIQFNNLDIKIQQSINKIQFIHQFLVVLDNEGLEIHTHIRIFQIDEIAVSLV